MGQTAGEFVRDTKYLDGRITADGRDGWPVQPDRYRLVVMRPSRYLVSRTNSPAVWPMPLNLSDDRPLA